MTYQELEQAVSDLQNQVSSLIDQFNQLSDGSQITLDIENALVARGFIRVDQNLSSGVVYSNGDGTFAVIAGAAGTVYVATISGGANNFAINFDRGVRNS